MTTVFVNGVTLTDAGWFNDVDDTAYSRIIYLDSSDIGAVGDGSTDDAAAFAAALTLAGSTNAVIYGGTGKTYFIGAAGVSIANKTNVKLIGNGAKIKVGAVATQAPAGLGSTVIFMDTCTNTKFTGWDIDGNAKASNVIGAKGNTDCEISFNKISSGGLTAQIFAIGNTRGHYLFNKVGAGSGTARGLWLGNYAAAQMEADIVVMGNEANSCPATGIVCASIGGRIVSNEANSNAGSGIIFGGSGGFSSKKLTITSNTCRSNTFHGIQSDVTYATVADIPVGIAMGNNICELNSGCGIFALYVSGATIAGNICLDNTTAGIFGDELDNFAIGLNECRDTRAGGARTQQVGLDLNAQVNTSGIINGTVQGNICTNNTFYGLRLNTVTLNDSIDNVAVNSNICCSNSADGLRIVEGAAGTINAVSVDGNICQSNTTVDLRVDPINVSIGENIYTTESSIQYLSFTDLDTTPSVKGRRESFRAANSGATVITALDDGVNGQTVTINASTANTTVNTTATIRLNGAANFAMGINNQLTLRRYNGIWMEISRGTAA